MKPYNVRKLIGVVTIDYGASGLPIAGAFQPAQFPLKPEEVEKILIVPASTIDSAVSNAQAVLSDWFLKVENIETADRETSRVVTEIISCEKWNDETPKHCELAFYFETTETKPRRLTGVR